LCEVIAAGSSITALDLRGCNIRTGGAAALAKLLQTNNTLRTLDLEWNGIGSSDEAVAIIADALAVNQGLTSLDLRNNSVSPQGACHLARALGANKALHRLDLRWNDVGVFGGNALAHALEANRTLCEMLLSGNKVCEDALAKIDDLVQRNRAAVRPVRSRRRRPPLPPRRVCSGPAGRHSE
jgi:Ran GTPase-activating protein (RanGAP) involved in mRNA processing and transport